MEQKTVRIACQGAATLPLSGLFALQGNLKTLPPDNAAKLRAEILEMGFSAPFNVWKQPMQIGGFCMRILDGHQRLAVLRQLEKEGVAIPELPVAFVDAASEAEAKRKLLGMASQYGRVDPQGLHDYVVEAGIEWDEMAKSFATPDINMEAMLRDYFEVSDAEMVEAGLIDPNPSPLIAHDQETRYDFVVRCDTAEQLQKVRDFFSATKATVSFAAAARYLWD